MVYDVDNNTVQDVEEYKAWIDSDQESVKFSKYVRHIPSWNATVNNEWQRKHVVHYTNDVNEDGEIFETFRLQLLTASYGNKYTLQSPEGYFGDNDIPTDDEVEDEDLVPVDILTEAEEADFLSIILEL